MGRKVVCKGVERVFDAFFIIELSARMAKQFKFSGPKGIGPENPVKITAAHPSVV